MTVQMHPFGDCSGRRSKLNRYPFLIYRNCYIGLRAQDDVIVVCNGEVRVEMSVREPAIQAGAFCRLPQSQHCLDITSDQGFTSFPKTQQRPQNFRRQKGDT